MNCGVIIHRTPRYAAAAARRFVRLPAAAIQGRVVDKSGRSPSPLTPPHGRRGGDLLFHHIWNHRILALLKLTVAGLRTAI